MATLTFEEATSVKCFSCRNEAAERVFLADDDIWGESIEELLSDVFPAEITERCREVAIGYEPYGVGLCETCVRKLQQTSHFLSKFCESLLGFEVPAKAPSAKRKRPIKVDATIKKKMKTGESVDTAEGAKSGLKEIMRIIIDSADASKLIQSEVTIAEDQGEKPRDDAIDVASMLTQQAVVDVDDNSEEEAEGIEDAGNESDGSRDEASGDVNAAEGGEQPADDHSYFVQTAAHEETKQAAIHRQVMRTRRYVRKRKRELPDSSEKEDAKSDETQDEETNDPTSNPSQNESARNETETVETPVADVDWGTIKRVMDNVVFVNNNDGVPKEIHVRIGDDESRKLKSYDSSQMKTEIPESVESLDKTSDISNLGLGKLPKMLTCAYCDLRFEDMGSTLAHYDVAHDESVEDLIARTAAKMGTRVRERMQRYTTEGIEGVEVKLVPGGRASPEEGEDDYKVCQICYFKFRTSEYEPHLLLQHYWARIKAQRKQYEDSGQTVDSEKRKPRVPICCEECGCVFNIYEAFCAHMWEVHHIEEYRREGIPRVKRYARTVLCETCGKYFKNKHSLQCHISEFHNKGAGRPRRSQARGGGPFNCDLCSYTTPEARRLRAHISRVHLGVSAYKCPLCTYTTSEQTALRHHKYTHTATKPISCHYCNFRCVQKHDIRSHLKRSHGVVIEAVRSLRHYDPDPDIARQKRKEAIEEQKRHFTETKDEQLHSCRGNEYYGEPYGDDNPYPRTRVRTPKSLGSNAFEGEYSNQVVESSGGVEYFFTEDGMRIELEPPGYHSNAESHQATRILAVPTEDEAKVFSDKTQIKTEPVSNVLEATFVENGQLFLKPDVRIHDVVESTNSTEYVMEMGEDSTGHQKFAIVSKPTSGGDVISHSVVNDVITEAAHEATEFPATTNADGDVEATFMIEIGTDESGNTKFAMITNEQLGALSRDMSVKANALNDVIALPQAAGNAAQLGDASSDFVEVTSHFVDSVTSHGVDSQGHSGWNSQGFTLNYEAGIPSDYSA